jgi:hypothetical protein
MSAQHLPSGGVSSYFLSPSYHGAVAVPVDVTSLVRRDVLMVHILIEFGARETTPVSKL